MTGLVPEGYELTDASYSDVDVAYGDEDEVVFKASVKETDTETETEEETEPAEELAYGHFPRPAGPHFPDSLGRIKRTAQ